MSSPDAIGEMVAATLADFGRLDILVNNAGIQHVAPLERFPVAKWDQILAIDLSAAFHSTQHALPAMRRQKFGRIINVASAHGLVASPFKAAYVAAKHGIIGLTKVAALETAEDGITCNAICPGYVYTPLVETQIDGQAKAHGISRDQVIRDVLLAQQPNKRFATVEEIGALTVFLAGEAAASITGIALPVDGGWTAHRVSSPAPANPDCGQQEPRICKIEHRHERSRLRPETYPARSCSFCRAAARSAPTRQVSTKPCTKPASSRTGSSARRSAPSMRA